MVEDAFTTAVHGDAAVAELPDVAPAIRPATTFARGGVDHYRRHSSETVRRLEAVLGALEGGEAVVYPSGMGAVAALLHHLAPRRIHLPDECYHGVSDHVEHEARRGAWERAGSSALGPGDVWWVETPSNPRCLITDVAAVASQARAQGASCVVDATFATPVLQDTVGLGAAFAVHASTKFIAGHSDAMGGVVTTGDPSAAADLREARARDGLVPGAFETWLTLRGVRTLPLRVLRQSETALAVARHLSDSVPVVHYPGLESHPGHEIAGSQMRAFGGVVSFDVLDRERAATIVNRLRVFRNATSLGGVESLAEHRLVSDPRSPEGLIRLSIGLEDPGALIADLDEALRS